MNKAGKLKIGIIAHLHYPIKEPFAGGLEAHTHTLAKQLMERGHEVTLFATPQSDTAFRIEPIHHELLKVDYTILPQTNYNDDHIRFHQEHHAYQGLMLRLRDSDFDVIHNNSVHYLPISMAGLLPMPVLTVLHTPPFPWLDGAVRLGKHAGNTAFAVVSEALGQRWRDALDKYHVTHNGVDTDFWAYSPQPERYAAWTGRFVPEKGAHFAIDAAHKAGMKLRLAGTIQDREYFDREVQPRLDGDIEYVGHLDHKATHALVSKASVFVATPCWDEPFGLTVAEAMASGTPVAAFARGAMLELVREGGGVVVPSGDVDTLAQAMKQCVGLDRACVRKRGETFSVKRMVDAYEALYCRLMDMDTAIPARQKRKVYAAG